MQTSLPDTLLNSLPFGVFAVDHHGIILATNQRATAQIAGLQESLGASITPLVPGWADIAAKLASDAFPPDGQLHTLGLANGAKARAIICPLAEAGWSVTLQNDATQRTIEADQADMLGEITHDLKEPLTAILSFSDLIKASGELNAKQARFLERIRAAANRMSDQVYQLLDVVWIESGTGLKMKPTQVSSLLKMALDVAEPRASAKHIHLAVESPPILPQIQADPKRLERVLINLVNNAVKYSGENTTVTVQVRTEGSEVVVTVNDQGIGIAPEHLPRIFDRFYRVEDHTGPKKEGTGLGLYVTKSIIEQHGGRITVESIVGTGSTFTVYLPSLPA